MVYAILHTSTRVVRRLTTESPPPMASDESAVEVPANTDLAGGYKALNLDGTLRAATEQEIVDARVDPVREAARLAELRDTMRARLDDLCDQLDAASSLAQVRALLKAFFVALRTLYRG